MSLEAGYPDAPGGVGYYIVGGGGSDVRSNAMKRRCDRCPPALEALGGEEGGWGGPGGAIPEVVVPRGGGGGRGGR